MSSSPSKPVGTRFTPSLICAVTGSVLAIGLSEMGFFIKADLFVAELWERKPFDLVDPIEIEAVISWVVAFMSCWVLSYCTLDSAKLWRRCLLLAMGVFLAAFLSPTMMLWGILWSPVLLLVGLSWTWLCSVIYASQHTMPCDGVEEEEDIQMKVETIPFPVKKAK